MASGSRTAEFTKLQKALKKHYKPTGPDPQRSVLEHLLFACVLEDAPHDLAEEAFAALVHTFFDWNEVRVTSVSELAEVMSRLPAPRAAATRLKCVLHSVFEAKFSFELEDLRKQNLGPAVKWLEKLDGTDDFIVAYVAQAALGGHRIPVDRGTLATLYILGLITDKERDKGEVPGLERAVAKSKGPEVASLMHQLGAAYTANPYSPKLRKILLEIEPECKERLPRRRTAKKASEAAKAARDKEYRESKTSAKKKPTATKATKGKAAGKKPATKKTTSKKTSKSKAAASKPASKQTSSKRKPR